MTAHMRLAHARPLLAAALLALAAPLGRLRAQTPLALGTWNLFEWFLGPGPVEGSGFLLDATQRTRLRVTDDGVTGDAFDVYVNGALAAATPSLPGGVITGALDGDAAWGTPGLSRAQLLLDPGHYTITLAVRETGSGIDFGEGFIRADAAPGKAPGPNPVPTPGVVPEPSSVASLAGGLGALVLVARRRARRG